MEFSIFLLNPCTAELFVSIFHSLEAENAEAIFKKNEMNRALGQFCAHIG